MKHLADRARDGSMDQELWQEGAQSRAAALINCKESAEKAQVSDKDASLTPAFEGFLGISLSRRRAWGKTRT